MTLKSPKPMTRFPDAVKKFYKNLFNFKDCSTRSDYWWAQLGNALIALALIVVFGVLFGLFTTVISKFNNPIVSRISILVSVIFGFGFCVYLILTMIGQIALTARRLHDINFSGWWQLFPYAMLLIMVIVFIYTLYTLTNISAIGDMTAVIAVFKVLYDIYGVLIFVATVYPSRESKYRSSDEPGNHK